MRTIITHRFEALDAEGKNPIDFKPGVANDYIIVEAGDELTDKQIKGEGKSHASYNFFVKSVRGGEWSKSLNVRFHQGPLLEENPDGSVRQLPVQGVTNEAVLAMVLDRLEVFQKGKFACNQNQFAIERIKEAIDALKAREAERFKAGIVGTCK